MRHGAAVLAIDINGDALRSLAESHDGKAFNPDNLHLLTLDLADPQCAERALATATKVFGKVDGLVNNAGIGKMTIRPDFLTRPLRFMDVEPHHWQRFLAINTTAPFLMMRAFIPHMLANGFGRIIYVGTTLELMATASAGPYGPSKAAAEAITGCAARDLAGTGITINVIVPNGVTLTGFVPPGVDTKGMQSPDVMVPPFLWLMSDDASETTAKRFRANKWDTSLSGREAAAQEGRPIAW